MNFSDLFAHSYDQITQLAPSKPLMIGEWGSAEQGAPAGASKAAWIADALGNQIPNNFPRIKAQVWYDWQFDGVDWRLQSSQSAAEAWRAAISSPIYLDNQFGALSASPIPDSVGFWILTGSCQRGQRRQSRFPRASIGTLST